MAPTEEDLAWFRSTFHPIPKPSLPDDCVDYRLYIFDQSIEADNESERRLRLREVQTYASELQKLWLKDYIWQRQGFGLESGKEDGVTLLRGQTQYGDSVEDEWVIVWLLRELTKKFEDLWIKVNDSDGEFLLIEAAGMLPEWLEPEVAENRIWIHGGGLSIVKPQLIKAAKAINEKLSVQKAQAIALKQPDRLLKSKMIEAEAFHRLRYYPDKIAENMHHTTVRMPRRLAFLLHQKPAYIAPAIEAFYLRDPISLKPLQSKSDSVLIFQPEDLVTFSIKIPRVGFAQMKSQDFQVPAVWANRLPSKSQTIEYERAQIGMKLCCGFEMLLSDAQNQDKPAVREMKMLLEDLESGDETLPLDSDIAQWPLRHDNEEWLDISFEDLEGELDGNRKTNGKKGGEFGDKDTQENLQRIVSQFEQFLNDDKAGPDGAGFFGEDSDDSEDVESDEDKDDDDEDKEASFDEDRFARMMHEMMGMGGDANVNDGKSMTHDGVVKAGTSHVEEVSSTEEEEDDNDDDDDAAEIQSLMHNMEAELKETGVLDIESESRSPGAVSRPSQGQRSRRQQDVVPDSTFNDEETSFKVNLAKNLLESFKSQAGSAAPGGNLMGLMGMKVERDEQDDGI